MCQSGPGTITTTRWSICYPCYHYYYCYKRNDLPGDHFGQPIATAVFGQDRIIGRAAVVENEVVTFAGAIGPCSDRT